MSQAKRTKDRTPTQCDNRQAFEHRFRVRATLSLVALAGLSLGSWLLFSAAQAAVAVSSIDHRHTDSWAIMTAVLGVGWVAGLILDYNTLREQRRFMHREALAENASGDS